MNTTQDTRQTTQDTQTTHTPGAWISAPINKTGDLRVWSTDDPTNSLYCEIQVGWGWDAKLKAEANARLIAAAPELLAACQSAFDLLDAWGFPDETQAGRASAELRAAIAKATGKS